MKIFSKNGEKTQKFSYFFLFFIRKKSQNMKKMKFSRFIKNQFKAMNSGFKIHLY